ncbi:MAG: Probable phosphoglycerate mutase [uncultured Thiotrichaceae bacterium]|uniref:Probable phosphoglycerate mutase n=1 Tax=uncultured Thiotrichaceae bacterium TaxID=298394 RepID=A0A6S6SU27_9GAMM|nr:MAG: Probable phosphoglycerate mutase [uncultured Thiotrichaceae bacterium]
MPHRKTIIDCIRHGEPLGGRMYRGSGTDHLLSEPGWTQMHEQIETHLRIHSIWDVVITSPMSRCLDFAEDVKKEYRLPCEIVYDFREASYGVWEGLTPDEVKEKFGRKYTDFYKDPVNNRPKGAESLYEFSERVATSLEKVFKKYKGKRILLISHAGVMRAMMCIVLKTPLASQQQIHIPYAGMVQLIEEKRGRRISIL